MEVTTEVPASRAGRRLGIVTIDQAISGGSNVLAAVIAAQWLGAGEFGIFGLVFLTYGLVQGVFRSIVGTPALVRPLDSAEALGEILGTSWIFGVLAGLACVVLGLPVLLYDRDMGVALMILGLAMPLLVVQDLGRFLAIGKLRPVIALWLDLIWLALMLLAAGAIALSSWRDLPAVMAMWAGSGMVAGVVAALFWRAPRLVFSLRWLKGNWDLSWRFTVAFVAAQASALVLAVMVRGLLGAAILGALVGAQLLMRPYLLVESAVLGSGFAEIAHDPSQLKRHVRRVTVAATVVAGINGLGMVLIPDSLGELALGATWDSAEAFMLPFAAQLVVLALCIGPRVGVVGIGRIDIGLILSVAQIPILLVFCAVTAVLWGAVVCAWAVTVSWAIAAAAWWLLFNRLQAQMADGEPSAAVRTAG